MKQFLLIQKTSPLRDYIELYLKAYHDVMTVNVESISESLNELSSGMKFDCIFIGSSLVVDGEAKELTGKVKEYITANNGCKVIGTNKGLSVQDWVIYVPSMAPPFKIFETIRNGLTLADNVTNQDFVAVPIFCLNYFSESPCDIYFRIGNSEDATYVKRFNEAETLEPSDITRYLEKNVKHVYINPVNVKGISDTISAKILNKARTADGSITQMEITTEALDYASYVLNSIGVDSNSQEEVQKVVATILSNASKWENKRKAKNFQEILNTKEDFYHKHVSLTAMLATSILDELKWETTDEIRSALTYASFFHNFYINNESDITCIDHASLGCIQPAERQTKIQNHAKMAVEFVKDIPGVPYDVQKLIMEQHGSLQGVGFPEMKSTSNQLSSLFMISNEFALKFLVNFESNSGENVQELLKNALALYGRNNLKVLEGLQNCIAGFIADTN